MKQNSKHKLLKNFAAADEGATLVELAMVLPVLLLLVLGAAEYGRFGYHQVMAQQATEIAVRTAAVRPPACPGVPDKIDAVTGTGASPKFGTLCRAGSVCATPNFPNANFDGWSCTLAENNTTADEIWATVSPLLPNYLLRSDVWVYYGHNPDIGFLGGPYTPVITVELARDTDGNGTPDGVPFDFITPLGALASLTTGTGPDLGGNIILPSMSASLPAEDLGQGMGF